MDYNNVHQDLLIAQEYAYKPSGLAIQSFIKEGEGQEYNAAGFDLNGMGVKFRTGKITPTKIGQFVAFWEKDNNNKNRPFLFEEAPELLVVTTFKNNNEFGQFVFPKDILVKKNILRTTSTTGKMAIRVYPSWDTPTSKQALNTQKWQAPYFVDMSMFVAR